MRLTERRCAAATSAAVAGGAGRGRRDRRSDGVATADSGHRVLAHGAQPAGAASMPLITTDCH
eukprot:2558041-Prymnesium_polylepis.1